MKAVEFGQKFICFSLVIEDGKRVVNISEVCRRLLRLRKKLFFVISNKDNKDVSQSRIKWRSHSYFVCLLVRSIIEVELNRGCSALHQFNRHVFIHPSNSPLKKRKTNVYHFLMFTSKKQILALKPVYTGNPLSPASICLRSPLVLSNVK